MTLAIASAVIWGCTPIWTYICGGKPIQQLLGTTYGALVVGIVLYFIKQPYISTAGFWWCFLAGAGWTIGQLAQYTAFKRLSTSTTVPIVAGIQLVLVDLSGVLFFGSWPSLASRLIGFFAILVVIFGVVLSTRTGRVNTHGDQGRSHARDIMMVLLGTGLGYGSCSVLPKIPETSGWATFPPQSIGMIVTAVLIALALKQTRNKETFFGHYTLKNIITGFNSGLGTFSYLGAIVLINLSTGFTISQMNIVISSVAGLLFMHENKHGVALANTIAGLTLVVIGGVVTGFLH
ncbi:GRP family sugar transporter [Acetilactobacillus jinshanensis]|uniref:Ribose uptake protein RbsU n=1 Tax=Acetilactobacillus jinshanensis TaxID=1720083 RepID=A0A4P6ZK58_9LACO|nr:GRP family sugar transporter [Acetilactobacillus jinshanensis]QBP18151.1 ribose uptake protein RbsU [Acetilactobacillus jinshanensis]URL61017.1 ribose uptake protein RbsU [uncultured bacterium]